MDCIVFGNIFITFFFCEKSPYYRHNSLITQCIRPSWFIYTSYMLAISGLHKIKSRLPVRKVNLISMWNYLHRCGHFHTIASHKWTSILKWGKSERDLLQFKYLQFLLLKLKKSFTNGRGSKVAVAVASPKSQLRVQCRGHGSNVAVSRQGKWFGVRGNWVKTTDMNTI